jgi:hypothetical protein
MAADTLYIDSQIPPMDSTKRKLARSINEELAEADSILRARGGSHANDAQLFLSWDAPWGTRRARRERRPACRDSAVADTLYLCMQTGRPSEKFQGFTAELNVRAMAGDTLGPWWHMQGKGGHNPGAMRVEFASTQDWGVPQPFQHVGQGFVVLEPSGPVARVRLIFAVPSDAAGPVEAKPVYALARVILLHRPERALAGCSQPVVIEWTKATLAFGLRDEPMVARGERYVTFSGPFSLADAYRGAPAPKSWKPPAPTAPAKK